LTGEGGSNIKRIFVICTCAKYEDGQIKKDKMGVAHGTTMGERSAFRMLLGKAEGERYLRDTDVYGRIIFRCLLKKFN
jgi:hypothetical protein